MDFVLVLFRYGAGGSSNRAIRLRLEWAYSVRDGFPSDVASSDARGGRSDLFASRRFGFPYRTTFRILVLCERKAIAKGSGPTISVTPVSCAVSRQERLRSAPCFPLIANSALRSEENTSELQSLMRISYAVFCLKKQ